MKKIIYCFAVLLPFFGCSQRAQEGGFVTAHLSTLQNALVLGNVFFDQAADMEYDQYVKNEKLTIEVLNDRYAEVNFLAAVHAVQSEEYEFANRYITTVMEYDRRNGYFIMLALLCAEQAGFNDAIRLYSEANAKANFNHVKNQTSSVFMDVINGASIQSCNTCSFTKSQRDYLEFLAEFKNKIEKNKGQLSKDRDTITK